MKFFFLLICIIGLSAANAKGLNDLQSSSAFNPTVFSEIQPSISKKESVKLERRSKLLMKRVPLQKIASAKKNGAFKQLIMYAISLMAAGAALLLIWLIYAKPEATISFYLLGFGAILILCGLLCLVAYFYTKSMY